MSYCGCAICRGRPHIQGDGEFSARLPPRGGPLPGLPRAYFLDSWSSGCPGCLSARVSVDQRRRRLLPMIETTPSLPPFVPSFRRDYFCDRVRLAPSFSFDQPRLVPSPHAPTTYAPSPHTPPRFVNECLPPRPVPSRLTSHPPETFFHRRFSEYRENEHTMPCSRNSSDSRSSPKENSQHSQLETDRKFLNSEIDISDSQHLTKNRQFNEDRIEGETPRDQDNAETEDDERELDLDCDGGETEGDSDFLVLNEATLADVLGTSPKGYDLPLLKRALLDCYGRFILNLPSSLLADHVHYHFQVQEAHWWYTDFWFDQYKLSLPNMSLKSFGLLLWELFPMLREYIPESRRSRLLRDWVDYCRTIPLRGAIILNTNWRRVLLVQGWKGGRWTFPRGKVDEQESDDSCAVREVLEEVGMDISGFINREMFIERRINKQLIKLFIIPGVSENTTFGPQKRKEISSIRWVSVSSLSNGFYKQRGRLKSHAYKFTHVAQFIKPLLAWLLFMESRRFDVGPNASPDKWTAGVSKSTLRRLQASETATDTYYARDDLDESDEDRSVDLGQTPPSPTDTPKKEVPEVHETSALHPVSPSGPKEEKSLPPTLPPDDLHSPSAKHSALEPPTPSLQASAQSSLPGDGDSVGETLAGEATTAEALLEALLQASRPSPSPDSLPSPSPSPGSMPPARPRSLKSIGVATVSSAARLGTMLRRFSRSRGAERRGPLEEPSLSETQQSSRQMKCRVSPACGDTDSPDAASSAPSTPEARGYIASEEAKAALIETTKTTETAKSMEKELSQATVLTILKRAPEKV